MSETGDDALQRAARQMIGAARSFLDSVEAVVDDPEALRALLGTLAATAQDGVRSAARAGRRVMGVDGSDEATDQGE
jgi:hypothetical protein